MAERKIYVSKWEDLPEFMKTAEVRPYWETLNKKKGTTGEKESF